MEEEETQMNRHYLRRVTFPGAVPTVDAVTKVKVPCLRQIFHTIHSRFEGYYIHRKILEWFTAQFFFFIVCKNSKIQCEGSGSEPLLNIFSTVASEQRQNEPGTNREVPCFSEGIIGVKIRTHAAHGPVSRQEILNHW